MKCEDFCFAGDPRLSDVQNRARVGAVIREVKTGRNQFVSLPSDTLIDRLKNWLQERPVLDSSVSLFNLTYLQLDRHFRKAVTNIGLGDIGYSLHSLRHGGATQEWLAGAAVANIMERGLWRCQETVKRYLNSQRALLVQVNMTAALQNKIRGQARRWHRSVGEGGSSCAA